MKEREREREREREGRFTFSAMRADIFICKSNIIVHVCFYFLFSLLSVSDGYS